jgi:predicted DNA-binding antitoxin AbrB/MazE fold protein
MSQVITATFENGLLKPDEQLHLALAPAFD